MRYALPLIALAAVSAPVVAQQMQMPTEAPGKPNPALAKPGRYKVDPGHTQALFTVNHLGFTLYTGQFPNASGSLALDTANPAASKVEVTFKIADVRTTVTALDQNLNGPDFFDAAKYPTASFVSTKVTKTSANTAAIAGNLTIKGITRPVTLKARFVGAGQEFWGDKKAAIGFAATTTIRRSEFGMGANVPLVSDNVDLVINAGFEAE